VNIGTAGSVGAVGGAVTAFASSGCTGKGVVRNIGRVTNWTGATGIFEGSSPVSVCYNCPQGCQSFGT
jgi:hypothetical protein